MKRENTNRVAGWAAMAGLLAIWLVTACQGTPTRDETGARRQAQEVGRTYRPQGQKPPLPVLTTNSSLGDLLTYAWLNQPAVEAAYYDWLAALERITTARSLPDPQVTFQMDIQKAVTSVMPGLMAFLPAPGKLRAGAEVATAESQARYFAFQTAALRSAADVKRAYYQLHFQEEKLRVDRENARLAAELETLARAQNEVGKVTLSPGLYLT